MVKKGKPGSEWLKAAAPPDTVDSIPKETISMRMDAPLVECLKSMAGALQKPYSKLAAELIEGAIRRFDQELPELRPDLVTTEEDFAEEIAMGMPQDMIDQHVGGVRWKTVNECYARARLAADSDDEAPETSSFLGRVRGDREEVQ